MEFHVTGELPTLSPDGRVWLGVGIFSSILSKLTTPPSNKLLSSSRLIQTTPTERYRHGHWYSNTRDAVICYCMFQPRWQSMNNAKAQTFASLSSI
ncbi:hypothetical protein VNO80_09681 [Phaseolus coccineus]|uniref:Uncharacterized protein n=1 Tax=Phaseolus coccineus TaxID=3886 RepID=A0AAN9NBY2_PHACN